MPGLGHIRKIGVLILHNIIEHFVLLLTAYLRASGKSVMMFCKDMAWQDFPAETEMENYGRVQTD